MKLNYKNIVASLAVVSGLGMTSCSDSFLADINNDDTKTASIDPNAQLTTSLLQTYGDFGMMDTYRSYITTFTQHFAGSWNATNYGGSVHHNDDQCRLVWDKLYSISIKNLNDGILHTADKPNLNAALRIHKVYLMSVLTDMYGDVPCQEAGWTGIKAAEADSINYATPRYDHQEDIYKWIFEELTACVKQLGTGVDRISGDVTSLGGDTDLWKKYANSLRMRYAMRISDADPVKAQKEFEAAITDPAGYISNADEDAYIKYLDKAFTLYDGASEMDYRTNSLGAILYGQDPTSPSFICTTLFNILNENSDPRLYAVGRHYLNTARSEVKPDVEGNIDVTNEVRLYLSNTNKKDSPCNVGAAWYNNWVNAPSNSAIPTLARLAELYPEVGYDRNNFPARMMRPMISIYLEQPDCPGVLITSAEVNYLLSEAKTKGWTVTGDAVSFLKTGIRESIKLLNTHYLPKKQQIDEQLISEYISSYVSNYDMTDVTAAREAINTQAWILHMLNPNEGWANLRRADYPVLTDRSQLAKFDGFTYDDNDLSTPVRLRYPLLEKDYNNANYLDALDRMGGKDDWHKRVWWDKNDINVK